MTIYFILSSINITKIQIHIFLWSHIKKSLNNHVRRQNIQYFTSNFLFFINFLSFMAFHLTPLLLTLRLTLKGILEHRVTSPPHSPSYKRALSQSFPPPSIYFAVLVPLPPPPPPPLPRSSVTPQASSGGKLSLRLLFLTFPRSFIWREAYGHRGSSGILRWSSCPGRWL